MYRFICSRRGRNRTFGRVLIRDLLSPLSYAPKVGPKGLEPSLAGLKVRCAAVTPRPQNAGRAYAFPPGMRHDHAPCSSGSPENRTQHYSVISRVWATSPRLPCANVVVDPVGMAGLEPASPCSQSTWVRRYPTSRQSERPELNRRSPGPRPGAITKLRYVLSSSGLYGS